MTIREINERTPELIERLTAVWESSARATHTFLSEQELMEIKKEVPGALRGVGRLFTAEDEEGIPAAFMGVEGPSLEMLFVSAAARGRGMGGALLRYGTERCGVRTLAVNEQNPQARGFYEHMGFAAVRRTELDEQGRPCPLVYMELRREPKHIEDGGR